MLRQGDLAIGFLTGLIAVCGDRGLLGSKAVELLEKTTWRKCRAKTKTELEFLQNVAQNARTKQGINIQWDRNTKRFFMR